MKELTEASLKIYDNILSTIGFSTSHHDFGKQE